VTGEAETVLSRGQPVIEKGRYVGKKGHGRFVARSGNEYLL
jgi:dihydropyrimidinase